MTEAHLSQAELKRRLQRLSRDYEKVKTRLAEVGFICEGSLAELYTSCGNPNCRSRNPDQRHGPYWQLTWPLKAVQGSNDHAARNWTAELSSAPSPSAPRVPVGDDGHAEGEASYVSALALMASNSAWVIVPVSRSCLAFSISAAAPPVPPAVLRTYSSNCACDAWASVIFRSAIPS